MDVQSPIRYLRIKIKDKKSRFYLSDIKEKGKFLMGTLVNNEGEEIVKSGIDKAHWLIQKTMIVKTEEYRMNKFYGFLEPLNHKENENETLQDKPGN